MYVIVTLVSKRLQFEIEMYCYGLNLNLSYRNEIYELLKCVYNATDFTSYSFIVVYSLGFL